jgi:hypothetical protein
MKSIYYCATVLFLGSMMFGCGSGPGTAADSGNTSGSGLVSDKGNSNAPAAAANQPIAGITGNSQPVGNEANTQSAGPVSMADRRKIVDMPGGPPSGAAPSVPAPENSSVSTTMDNSGTFIETRVFRDNQYISKVEKTSNGTRQTAKIFLKNGRLVNVAPAKIPAINAINVAGLMDLAGVRLPPSPPQKPVQTEELTKKGKQ